MNTTRYNTGGSGCYGDVEAWMSAHAPDNGGDIRRLKRNLHMAREQELTARQSEMLRLHYEEAMSVTQIARWRAPGEGFTNVCGMGYNTTRIRSQAALRLTLARGGRRCGRRTKRRENDAS